MGLLTSGLYDEEFWKMNRLYYINLERDELSDKMTNRNLTVNFKNNNNCNIDIIFIIIYKDKIMIDVETGIITK